MKDYKNKVEKNGNHLFRWLGILAVIVVLGFVVFVSVKIGQPASTQAEQEKFTVEPGQSGNQISAQLEAQGLINSSFFFDLYSHLKGYSGRIQAGEYLLSSGDSIREIADKLVSGEAISDAVVLTLIEGWGIPNVASRVEEVGLVSQTEFVSVVGQPRVGGADDFSDEFVFLSSVPRGSSLEGFLFPDTYFIDKESSAEDVVRKLLQNFDTKVGEELLEKSEETGRTFFENITLASIVEREVGRNVKKGTALSESEREKVSEERRIVAGIFLNRLEIGMALESDATVGYITGSDSSRATIVETRINSPYNTYQNRGLPPGPISNPSLDSIMAVIDPTESDYLFFLTSPDGTAYFAEDLDGHIRNRNLYLE